MIPRNRHVGSRRPLPRRRPPLGPPLLRGACEFLVVALRARVQGDADALQSGLPADQLAGGMAPRQKAGGVLVPERAGDLVDRLLLDLGPDQPLGADAEGLGRRYVEIGAGLDREAAEEGILLDLKS